jgi:hypothetical protein
LLLGEASLGGGVEVIEGALAHAGTADGVEVILEGGFGVGRSVRLRGQKRGHKGEEQCGGQACYGARRHPESSIARGIAEKSTQIRLSPFLRRPLFETVVRCKNDDRACEGVG